MTVGIVFINNSNDTFTPTNSGAIATFIWENCRVAKKESIHPIVISRNAAAQPYDWDKTILIDYPSVPENRAYIWFYRLERKLDGWRNLRQRSYAKKVAAMIAYSGLGEMPLLLQNDPEMAVFLRSRFPKARIIHHFHNQLECKERYRQAFSSASIISTAVSNFTARWVEGYYKLPESSVRTIYNGVDTESFRPAHDRPNRNPIVNFVGRTGIEKGADLLLEAALVVSKKTKNFEVQILGSNHWGQLEVDEYQKRLSTLADELQNFGIKVRRPGHIPRAQLPAELQKAQIHVVPSRWDEPFGLTTVEGMATGLAVIASNTGGTPEVVGESGLLFERDSVDELAKHLDDLVADKSLRADYGKQARARSESFTWQRTWKQLYETAHA